MTENEKYYAVKVKSGHVGKKYYVPVILPIIAETKKDAAYKARFYPRVKHHHKDAILEVKEVTYEEYFTIIENNSLDFYFKCKSRHEQNELCDDLKERLVEDPHAIKKVYGERNRSEYVNHKLNKFKKINSYQHSQINEYMYSFN